MSDPQATSPSWQLALGMLPSFNQSLIVIVTATCTFLGTIGVQHYTAKPVEPPKPVTVERIVERPVPNAVDLSGVDAKLDKLIEALGKNAGPGRKQKATLK